MCTLARDPTSTPVWLEARVSGDGFCGGRFFEESVAPLFVFFWVSDDPKPHPFCLILALAAAS